MNKAEAIGHVVAAATQWAENKQEGFSRNITAETTDEECAAIADESGDVAASAIELRDFDRAVKNPEGATELDHLLLLASSWTENTEDGFSERVRADTTDAECRRIALADDVDDENVFEVRDLWRAIDLLLAEQMKG